jgi:hypothetical protein
MHTYIYISKRECIYLRDEKAIANDWAWPSGSVVDRNPEGIRETECLEDLTVSSHDLEL